MDSKPDQYFYALGNLGKAVWKLATGPGVIKERLADAFIELTILNENDFPPELRDQWKWIIDEMTKGKMKYNLIVEDGEIVKKPVGKLRSTLQYMRNKKAVKIAKQICNLEAELSMYRE